MLDAEKIFASSKRAGKLEVEGVRDIVPVDPRAGELGGNLVDFGPLSRAVISSSSAWRLRDVDEDWTEIQSISAEGTWLRIGDTTDLAQRGRWSGPS